jgi:hypothetical protein
MPTLSDGRVFAATANNEADPLLRERVLAIPFGDVWQAAYDLLAGGLRGWSVTIADDREGRLEGVVVGWGTARHDVQVRIGLDTDAQTFLRAQVTAQKPGADFGRAARRLRRFLAALDQALARLSPPDTAGVTRK